eukprot:2616415-Pleurochrysis_carterae.AAC.1
MAPAGSCFDYHQRFSYFQLHDVASEGPPCSRPTFANRPYRRAACVLRLPRRTGRCGARRCRP